MQFPRGPVTNKLVIINLAIAAVLLVPSWWNYAVMAGGFFPIRFSNVAVAFPDTGFLVPTYLTPLSAAFLHGGIAHVLMNMLTLLLIGKMVERVLGGGLYLSLYFFSAYAASATEWLASFMALPLSIDMMARGPIPAAYARPFHLTLAWVGLNLALGFVGPGIGVAIAIWSHIGGFIAGLLLARPMLLWRYRSA